MIGEDIGERHGYVAGRIAHWLVPLIGADGPLRIDKVSTPELNGSSNQTLVLDARWTSGGRPASGGFVVRMAPAGLRLYHHYDLDAQYRTMAAVAATPIPLPPLVGYEPDPGVVGEPFYVMAKVEGQAPPDLPPFTVAGWVHDAPAGVQAQLYQSGLDVLARVHRLDVGRLDLPDLPWGFDDLLDRTEAWYRWAAGPGGHPVLDQVLAWLREHQPADPSPDVLNWGDARLGNMIFAGTAPVAILDWEMAAVVPGEVDLGWWLFLNRHHTDGMGVPRLPGFPTDVETVERYGAARGMAARHVQYYEAFAGFRFAIIFLRAMDAMGDAQAVIDNSCNRMLVADLALDAPWR